MIAPSPRQDGFALVEAIVAFLILATALAVTAEAIGRGGAAIRRADDIARSSEILAELSATRLAGLPGEGRWQGRADDGATWRMAARPIGVDPRLPPVYAVEIEIWPTGDEARAAFSYRTIAGGAPG